MAKLDTDELLELARDVWAKVENVHYGGDTRYVFHLHGADRSVAASEQGIGGAIARLCKYLDTIDPGGVSPSPSLPQDDIPVVGSSIRPIFTLDDEDA